MPLTTSVMDFLAGDAKPRKKGEGPPKRYIMFELDEWEAKVDKALGRPLTPTQAKAIMVNLFAQLGSGNWRLVDKDGKPVG